MNNKVPPNSWKTYNNILHLQGKLKLIFKRSSISLLANLIYKYFLFNNYFNIQKLLAISKRSII